MKFQQPQREDIGFQISPMVDVIFQLLVFFLLASTLASYQEYVKNLPVSTECKELSEKQLEVIVNVTEDGKIILGRTQYTPESLKSHLLSFGDPAKISIYIRGDKRVAWDEIRKVVKACAEVGISNMFFGTYSSK
jgi:biopolymer transport protein ExbD